MEFKLEAGNSIMISTKKGSVLVDPLGQTPETKVTKKTTVVVATQKRLMPKKTEEAFLVDGPGEYEISGLSIIGIPARAHTEEAEDSATMFKVMTSSVHALVVGHIHPKLSPEQLEAIGSVDVLVIPVGGNGYTLDAVGAATLVKAIEPKMVIPTHYKMSGVKYEVPQNGVDDFLKEIGSTEPEKTDKLKLKGGILPETLKVVLLK